MYNMHICNAMRSANQQVTSQHLDLAFSIPAGTPPVGQGGATHCQSTRIGLSIELTPD